MKIITFFLLLLIPYYTFSQDFESTSFSYNNVNYSFFPASMTEMPGIVSPCESGEGVEIIVAQNTQYEYVLIPVTVENRDSLSYKQRMYGKGRQLAIDSTDFPSLALYGFHQEAELVQAKTITGKTVEEINQDGQPEQFSTAGFLGAGEGILDVLKTDNQTVQEMQLKHADLAKPLFQVWNIALEGIRHGMWDSNQMQIDHIYYNGRKIFVKWQGSRGWQESIFNDEVLGQYQLEIWRELDDEESTFLATRYADLNEEEMNDLIRKLSYIHTGEMVPYYIMRYGFYEGHTEYRADPAAIAIIFGLKRIEDISDNFIKDIVNLK